MNSTTYCNYIESTLPNYLQQKLNDCFLQLGINQNIILCVDFLSEQIDFCRNLCNKLQAQKQLSILANLIEHQIYPIRDAEKNNTYLLSQQDVYVFQIILRLITIMIYFETKKYHANFDNDYKEKYDSDLVKAMLILRTNSRNQLDYQFLELFEKLKSTSVGFYKYLQRLCQQFSFKNSESSTRKQKLKLKKKQSDSIIEKRKQADTIKQESKGECSNSFFEQNDIRFKDKRLQIMMNVKQQKEDPRYISFQDALKQKENVKIANTNETSLSRPSLCKRTINGGINGKYKLGNEIKIIRKTNSLSNKKTQKAELKPLQILQQQQQIEFCKEVSRKLLQYEQQKKLNMINEYLAPETESEGCLD